MAGTTAVHICFGYVAIIHERPSGYSFLPELATVPAQQVSIETAQSNLDTSVLASLPEKDDHPRRARPSTHEVESAETVADRIERALPHVAADRIIAAPDCGMKYLPRDVAFEKMSALVGRGGAGTAVAPRLMLGPRQPLTMRPSTVGATGEFWPMKPTTRSSRASPGVRTSEPPASAV